MRFDALATDYDGTIAHDGLVDDETVAALQRGRDAGLRLIMVTGREPTDLFNTFAHSALFDRIVAENGAVLYEPSTKTVDIVAEPPPPALVERLTRRMCRCRSATRSWPRSSPTSTRSSSAIRDLGLEWHVIFNKGSVMALPADVTKATGLAPALAALGISPRRTIGVGDAENDQAFLRVCGLAVAVANALPSVKEMADLVTAGARGAGVIELLERVLAGELDDPASRSPLRRKPSERALGRTPPSSQMAACP